MNTIQTVFQVESKFFFPPDLLEGEDWDVLQNSIQEILKASVMAGVDVLSAPLTSLLDAAKNLSSFLPVLVPSGLYLPSPPLYCPQPSPNTQVRLHRKRPLLYAHDIPAGRLVTAACVVSCPGSGGHGRRVCGSCVTPQSVCRSPAVTPAAEVCSLLPPCCSVVHQPPAPRQAHRVQGAYLKEQGI